MLKPKPERLGRYRCSNCQLERVVSNKLMPVRVRLTCRKCKVTNIFIYIEEFDDKQKEAYARRAYGSSDPSNRTT